MSFTLTKTGEELYQQLKNLREQIANDEVIPVYYVFSNASLLDMVVKQPIDKESFLQCEKVGLKGYERYGEQFIDLIRRFILLNKGPYYTGEPEFKTYRHFLTAEGRRLLEILKTSRTTIAGLNHLDEQTMVSDQTLINFVVLLPYSREEMIRIYGVTREYRDLYMDEFIRAIYNFTHGFKKRLYHIDVARPAFFLTKEEASRFVYKPQMSATQIAKELNRISSSAVHISATDITNRVKKYDYYANGLNRTIIISDVGAAFGLRKETHTSKNGETYEMVFYNKEAQNKIVEWFIRK